ncbi:hypothetical protein ACHAPD_012238 [Fusarium lateritium]
MPLVLSKPSADDLWATAVDRLDQDLRAEMDFNHEKIDIVSGVLALTVKAQKECDAKAWRLRRKNGATVSVRDVLAKVVKWVNHFKDIGDIVVQYDPGHAALPWAGVRFLLQIVVDDFQTCSFVLESIESLAELLCRYACVEELLLRFSKAPKNGPSVSTPTQELQHALVQLYVHALTYLARARKYFQKSIAKQLNRHDRLKDMMSDLQAPLSRWSDDLIKITDQLDKTKRTEILEWLSKEPYLKHHRLVKEGTVEGTGQWLLSDPIYQRWKEDSASSILWLHGIPGSGKSKLVSLVVEDAIAAFEKHQRPPPAYFYCSRSPAEPARADPVAILASIARQLSYLKSGQALLHPTVAAYNMHEEEGFAAGSLQLHETRALIMRLSESYPTLTIIIDALDECDPATRETLMAAMEKILQDSSCLVKIFVSSRDDQDIVHKLRHYPNLELSSEKNARDIDKFVELETCRFINSGKLLRYSSDRDKLSQKIKERVASEAQGMFRWASLQLEALCELKSDQAILERLGRLPRTLEALYQEIFQKIENSPSVIDRQYARHVLTWLMCAQRRLSSTELLSAVSLVVPHQQLQSNQILDFCCNLVVLDTQLDTFRFAHLSVREFLERQEGYASSFSNGLAAETCLLTMFGLATDQFSKGVLSKLGYQNGIETNRLEDYSFAFWAVHCQAAAERRKEGQLRELLQGLTHTGMVAGSANTKWNTYLQRVPWDIDFGLGRKLEACCAAADSWAFTACAFDIDELLEWGHGFDTGELRNKSNQTCEQVAAAVGSGKVLRNLLSVDNLRITEAVVEAAASNWKHGKEVMALLLDLFPDQVQITEAVVEVAASNWKHGKEVMALLLDRVPDQVPVTNNTVSLIAGRLNEIVMALLLDRVPDQVQITKAVIKAAAGNEENGKEVMALLLDRVPDQVQITEAVIKAAASNLLHRKEVMALLLDRVPDQVQITEAVIKAAAGNEENGQDANLPDNE